MTFKTEKGRRVHNCRPFCLQTPKIRGRKKRE